MTERTAKKYLTELAEVRMEMAELQDKHDRIKQKLIDSGYSKIETPMWRLSIARVKRRVTNWRAIAVKLNAPPKLIDENTTSTSYPRVVVTAR